MDRLRVIAQLERILKSAEFSGAHRPSTFLRFIVECSLEQRAEQIKESVIAIEAFKRDASFEPKTDPIVRVEAGRLRDRLESYYAGEGQKDALLIHLPKGGYVPRFMERPIAPYKPPDVLTLSIVAPSGSRIDSFASACVIRRRLLRN